MSRFTNIRNTRALVLAPLLVVGLALGAGAQDAPPADAVPPEPAPAVDVKPQALSLDDLLKEVQLGWTAERAINAERESSFKAARDQQQSLLDGAEAALASAEQVSQQLETSFGDKELEIAQLEETLTAKLGTLGELFGVVRQVAGDTRSNIEASITSSQIGGDRADFLLQLGKSRALPAIVDLERLWYELHREMTESGKVVRFAADVIGTKGETLKADVVRIGTFNAVSDGKYLAYDRATRQLKILGKQPGGRYLNPVANFESATSGQALLGIDPSRGQILSLLIETPTFWEQLQFGGLIGLLIGIMGAFGALIAIWRWVVLFFTGRRVSAQQKSDTANPNNPLGRVLQVYEENQNSDPETLELKLDEQIMRETAKLESFLWLIKVVSVVAPLMGLLGTVTGMIRTFQMITLFGTGDPKMMAGGISEALVTTMLGLYVAIPMVLLHAFVSSTSKRIVNLLDEQSTGLVAIRSERGDGVA